MSEKPATPITPQNDNRVDVNVEAQEVVGIVFLSCLFFIVLLALLRSQKRERQLLREIVDLQAKIASPKAK